MINIAFTGGGTGGHIYPGLAVASELKNVLKDSNARIFWIGSSIGMDRALVESAGIEFFGIPSGKLRRYFSFKNFIDVFRIIGGFFAARRILKKQKAVLVFSKGGFVSVPPCAAAASLDIPVFTHESDFSPGLATKINTRFVLKTGGKIFTAYEDTKRFFNKNIHNRVITTGNPVRPCFFNADFAEGRTFLGLSEKQNDKIILVLGGSQGAAEINELIRAALPALTETFIVAHQTGPNLSWDIPASDRYKPYPYIKEEMHHVIAAADIIVGRSGAGIWEWAVLGKPMILIPLRGLGTRGDQIENAEYFKKTGAALVLGENPDADDLMAVVNKLEADPEKKKAMAELSACAGKCGGARQIAAVLKQNILGEKPQT
ncbi:MAG: undecaprenyldiphospho-muramoylpentapeptide beta-N-acetylglucosaminyltransferase [Treponema sp.]|nr:undecaprenyldiphospho-muramoylpentapeptide beta-N-acetylglucosaminyltransferase [Treponema sp.]